jgi:hypothetical protein
MSRETLIAALRACVQKRMCKECPIGSGFGCRDLLLRECLRQLEGSE